MIAQNCHYSLIFITVSGCQFGYSLSLVSGGVLIILMGSPPALLLSVVLEVARLSNLSAPGWIPCPFPCRAVLTAPC
ncbi:hypothetical protein M405DRAFT_386063 [Rhizopogon salebrosus TDB-379]|nr:hypothetical protein M405DRAFT_386063 [Rhizopogon salebrosus TDB-379]